MTCDSSSGGKRNRPAPLPPAERMSARSATETDARNSAYILSCTAAASCRWRRRAGSPKSFVHSKRVCAAGKPISVAAAPSVASTRGHAARNDATAGKSSAAATAWKQSSQEPTRAGARRHVAD